MPDQNPERRKWLSFALATFPAVALSLAAADDITTDKATTGFVPEWTALAVCAVWCVYVAWWYLFRQERPTNG